MRPALLAFLTLFALPLAAQDHDLGPPLTASEFEAYVIGRTLTYAEAGHVYGTEQYLQGRRVIWAFTKDQCREGHWYSQDQQICFLYEDPTSPQCWLFFKGDTGLKARFLGLGEGGPLSEVAQTQAPLTCAGPDVGV